jgi:hypothetical protein
MAGQDHQKRHTAGETSTNAASPSVLGLYPNTLFSLIIHFSDSESTSGHSKCNSMS